MFGCPFGWVWKKGHESRLSVFVLSRDGHNSFLNTIFKTKRNSINMWQKYTLTLLEASVWRMTFFNNPLSTNFLCTAILILIKAWLQVDKKAWMPSRKNGVACGFRNSGFHIQKFYGFRNLDCPAWGNIFTQTMSCFSCVVVYANYSSGEIFKPIISYRSIFLFFSSILISQ